MAGKTCLFVRYQSNRFTDERQPTVGIDFTVTNLLINKINIRLNIWDTSGKEKFRSLTQTYYKTTKAFILTYDITNRDSFECVPEFLKGIRSKCSESSIILVGLKSDLEYRRCVTVEEASIFAREENLMFTEASSKDGTNVEELLNDIAINVMNRFYSAKIPEKFYRLKMIDPAEKRARFLMKEEEKKIDQNFLQMINEREKQLQEEKLKKLRMKFQNNDKSFLYENKLFDFNFEAMIRHSNYLVEKKNQFKNVKIIKLFDEFDFIPDISNESIETFIHWSKCIDDQDFAEIKITHQNVFDIFILSSKYQIDSLKLITKRFISDHFDDTIPLFILKLNKYSNNEIETIVSENLFDIVNKFESLLLNLQLSILYRILSKYNLIMNQDDENKRIKIEQFFIKIIKINGFQTYEIFYGLKIGQQNPAFLHELLKISSNGSSNMLIIEGIINEMKNEINDLKNQIKTTNGNMKEQKHIIYSNMTSVTIPPEITVISNGLFQNCTKLREIHFSENLIEISDSAFENCSSLSSITLPSSLKFIGKSSFRGCTSLVKIIIPNEVDSIGVNAFEGCVKLKEMIIPSKTSFNDIGINSKTKIKRI